MTPIRHILVPRDFSAPSEAALHLALRIADRSDATLHLLHVDVLGEDPFGSPAEAASPGARLRERLKDLVEHDRADGPPFAPESLRIEHAVVREVAAGPAIARHASVLGADLIVMGRHGRRGLGRAMLGSVAEYVAREAACPVAMVPGDALAGNPSVLCASDLSPASAAAVGLAADLADALSARLDLVYVAPEVRNLSARDRLQTLVGEALAGRDLDVQFHLLGGDPAEGILDTVERLAPTLVVVGPRRRRGVTRLLGSVTEEVVRDSSAPVIVVQQAEVAVSA